MVDTFIKDRNITVGKGFVTDLASVPRAAGAIMAPWDVARAAIIHDLLYKKIRQYRYKMAIEIGTAIRAINPSAVYGIITENGVSTIEYLEGTEPIELALAFVLNQDFPSFPLIGPRNFFETRSSLKALEINLSQEERDWLDLQST